MERRERGCRCKVALAYWTALSRPEGKLEKKDASAPLDVNQLLSDVPLALHANWLRAQATGETDLDYDRWLEGQLWPRAAIECVYRQGQAVFRLQHRSSYQIQDPIRGTRNFRCLLDGQFPFVSFIGAQGLSLLWLTIPGLFSVDELVTLQLLAG